MPDEANGSERLTDENKESQPNPGEGEASERLPDEAKPIDPSQGGPSAYGGGRRAGWTLALALVSALIGGLIAAIAIPALYGWTPAEFYGRDRGATPTRGVIEVRDDGVSNPVTAVARKLKPSIVNITVSQSTAESWHRGLDGVGSGVVFRSDGYILTNAHVVSGTDEIIVTIGGDEVPGRVIASDVESDLAVIKVARKGLQAAEFGTTKGLEVGELAVAIGSPFGFEHTVTSGIISALNRTVHIPEEDNEVRTLTNMIQTDAPINPGNSGGALSDSSGRVIGINTVIISSSGLYEGVGFAIPVETVVSTAKELIKSGKASHPYMGVLGQDVDPEIAKEFKLTVEQGAVMIEVVGDSPAGRAGLKRGDVVVEADGESITSMDDLIVEIREHNVGDELTLVFVRDGVKKRATLRLVEKPRKP